METTTKLVYRDSFEKNAYSLVELGTPELVKAFESGSSIIIKGLPEDEAVLCTESKTYIVRQVNTSNSIVMIEREERHGCHYVHDDVSNTIELLPCLARLGRLDDLLFESSYSGQEIGQSKTLYTLYDLLSIVQASKEELLNGLNQRGAFEYKGYYRLFDKDYLFRLFDSLMTNAAINQLDIKCMLMEEAKACILEEMNKMDEGTIIPDIILEASINTMIVNTKSGFLQFDESKICRFLGEWMLTNPRGKKWKLEEFMELWNSMGHDIFTPKLEYLNGLFVLYETIKLQQIEKYISYFPLYELSTDPPQRFAALFSEKPLWTPKDIEPFLMDLAPSKKDRETLLLKFTRTHKNQNIVLYGSRIK